MRYNNNNQFKLRQKIKTRIPVAKKSGGVMKSKKDYNRFQNRKVEKEELRESIPSDQELLFSDCCQASAVRVCGMPDFIGDKDPSICTCWHECPECGKACNVIMERDL